MALTLYEYGWDGSNYVLSGTLVFSPDPSKIEKICKVQWRARHFGTKYTYPRAKYRYRREIVFKLEGGCSGSKREELEFFAMRNSKFKIDNTSIGYLKSPEYYSDRDTHPANNPKPTNFTYQTLYVMFEEIRFTADPGKEDWFNYSITLKVVNNEKVT